MKIRILISFFFLTFILMSNTAYAKEITGVCGSSASYSFDEDTGTMTISGSGAMYNNWNKKIQSEIRQLIIEEGITNTGKSSFKDAVKLKEVSLPDSLTEISDHTFTGCTSLTAITIPKNVTKKVTSAFEDSNIEEVEFAEGSLTVACQLFTNCITLKKVHFSNTIQVIRASAFKGCEKLCEINLPEGLEEIHYNAFQGCKSLKTITIPKSLKNGGTNCFAESGLEKITFEEGITNIPSELFSGCTEIRQISLPDSIQTIGYAAFSGCQLLTVNKLPPRLTEIGSNAFYNCKKITSAEFPDTLEKIGDYAYFGTGISNISLASHITYIGYYAFNRNTIIRGEDETQAESYVKKYGNPYVPTKRSLKNVSIADIPDQGHTGKAITPSLIVRDGDKILQPNINYQITYQNNVNFGTAKVTITGMDSYYFGTKAVSFLIIAPKGGIYKKGNLRYKVSDNRISGKGTVEVLGIIKQKKSVTIPKTIKIGKYKYKVTSIARKAFYKKKKIKKITISSTTIKKIGSKAVKGIYKNAKIKVPKKKKKSYGKMLRKAGLGKKRKIY